jgi:phenylpropionate dioxygenase-like ring-hydroxylating dioxygenase large terminal subunit
MVDAEAGTVDRAIFTDEAIYQLELERIFARAWNFMCHETQIPKAGDFFLSFIGEESVIATRDKKGQLQVLLNSCRHRGNAVCRAEEGNARSFLCTYHGWTYGLDGQLIGVPGYKDFYHEQLDKSQWGLVKAGKVASYKGFVFATMDPEAPDLEEYLGPVGRLALDLSAGRGTIKIVQGVQKNQIGCNWKLANDNLFDYYHPDISHASAVMNNFIDRSAGDHKKRQMEHRNLFGEYGHGIGGPRLTEETWAVVDKKAAEGAVDPLQIEQWRREPDNAAMLGDQIDTKGHRLIFPNLWVPSSTSQICLRLPKGPDVCEIWWFTIEPEEFTEAQSEAVRMRAIHHFGAAGLLEQEDGENWDQSTRAMKGVVARRYPLNFSMNLGLGEVQGSDRGLSYVDTHVSEHNQLWTYRAWADWMDAESWAALKRDHAMPPKAGERI